MPKKKIQTEIIEDIISEEIIIEENTNEILELDNINDLKEKLLSEEKIFLTVDNNTALEFLNKHF